ncbi:MAG: hypothetical protein OXT65_10860, partial [Alphaproteobacteria bacterium]|nr:hypothetical protein [Alphaproteobacteria bacterium]
DADLMIFYKDLEQGGLQAATQIFSYRDVGTPLGEGQPRMMMIDTNTLDYAALHHHDKFVHDQMRVPFVANMLSEGYLLVDKSGIGKVLQEKAGKFLKDGPAPFSQGQMKGMIADLETVLSDIRTADTMEEKRFLGVMAMAPVCGFVLGLNNGWQSGNQNYRELARYAPEEGKRIGESFIALLRRKDPLKVESLLEDYISTGRASLSRLPANDNPPLHPVEKHVPEKEAAGIANTFMKFIIEHVCEALDSSQKRGDQAHLENLSATVNYLKSTLEMKNGDAPSAGRAAMRYLNTHTPDLMPAVMQALDEKEFEPIRVIADDVLSHMGGRHYSRLENYYAEDVARVYAAQQSGQAKKKNLKFNAGFKP